MLDLIAIAQSSPGAIAVNGAIVVGYKLAGFPGIAVAILGAILPPMVILSLVSAFYHAFRSNPVVSAMLRGMRSGVGAVIVSVVYDMGCPFVKNRDYVSVFLMAAAFLAIHFFDVNVVLIIFAAALFGVVRTLWTDRHRKEADV